MQHFDVDVANRGEQRKFGLQMAAAFVLLALLRWWLKGVPSPTLFTLGLIFLIAGLATPFALRPVLSTWLVVAEGINWVMTRVLLSITFYGLITPGRYLNQVFGEDPLKRKWQPEATTYWEEPEEQPNERERYRNQF